jgi:mannan endo-1,4-beta-mannosidase
MNRCPSLLISRLLIATLFLAATTTASFVSVKDHTLQLRNKPYYFVGTNYWYGGLLGLEKERRRGAGRLRKELDFLKRNGVTNLRLMAGAEGSGMLNGVTRVGPPLQPSRDKFDESVLDGLDLVLAEMAKRDMKAVIFFSNNWEWSGGFQQYLIWNGRASVDLLTRKPEWDELRDVVARFYACEPCRAGYMKQLGLVVGRINKLNGRKYTDDPTIMAWELANEPRPMRPAANQHYKDWIRDVAAAIKSRDRNHLVTIGHEGSVGTESIELFEEIHRDPNIDYLTIHIWAKNWQWYSGNNFAEAFPKADEYIQQHIAVARRLGKPLVIEEFGLPRDGVSSKPGDAQLSFDPGSPTTLRDEYYRRIFSYIGGHVAGANFWAFGGTARPIRGQVFWKPGDEYMGDPPMEEQGLNTVFDNDRSTWKVIGAAARQLHR